MKSNYDIKKIICLTEESVETLYLLGKEELICGVSSFVKRPVAAQSLDKVSMFTSSNYKKIQAKKPDLILGHSDIQKEIARDLIELGEDVYIANHRSIKGILSYITRLANLVDAPKEGQRLISQLERKIEEARIFAKSLQTRPRVYFEEWDDPRITAIQWVKELIELCGGECITSAIAHEVKALDRVVSSEFVIDKNPDFIFGCWCGKKVRIKAITEREGWGEINAVKEGRVFELDPCIFLQPGPAPLVDGIDTLINYFKGFKLED